MALTIEDIKIIKQKMKEKKSHELNELIRKFTGVDVSSLDPEQKEMVAKQILRFRKNLSNV